jgi:hypothetical protein
MEDNISKIKARVAAMSKSFPDKNGMSAVEDNKAVSFRTLETRSRYSSKAIWYHPLRCSLAGWKTNRLQ